MLYIAVRETIRVRRDGYRRKEHMRNHANSNVRRLIATCAASTLLTFPSVIIGETSAVANFKPKPGLARLGTLSGHDTRNNRGAFRFPFLAQVSLGTSVEVDVDLGLLSSSNSSNDKPEKDKRDKDKPPRQGGAPVPEPSTWLGLGSLLAFCLFAVFGQRTRKT